MISVLYSSHARIVSGPWILLEYRVDSGVIAESLTGSRKNCVKSLIWDRKPSLILLANSDLSYDLSCSSYLAELRLMEQYLSVLTRRTFECNDTCYYLLFNVHTQWARKLSHIPNEQSYRAYSSSSKSIPAFSANDKECKWVNFSSEFGYKAGKHEKRLLGKIQ